MKTMNDLFLHFLQDIYYAEKAFAKSSGKIMKAVKDEQVREILQKAKEHANEPIEALDRVFEAVDKRPRGKACEAMNGLLAECQEAIEEGESGPVLDAALIACRCDDTGRGPRRGEGYSNSPRIEAAGNFDHPGTL